MSDPLKPSFPDRPSSVRWQMVGLMMAYSFMSWFNRVSMSVAGTERIMERYGITPTYMGFVYSALLLAYAVYMTPGGYLADRQGAWAALVLMGFGSALFVALTGVVGLVFFSAGTLWLALMVVRSLMGACTAPIYPASARIIVHWLPPRQWAFANGLVSGAALVGIACTFYGFGKLIDHYDWPGAFLITGAITALLAVIWWGWATDYPSQHRAVNAAELRLLAADAEKTASASTPAAQPSRRTGSLFRNRSLMLLTVSYACVGYFEYLFYFWTEHYFSHVLHLPKEESRRYATVLNLAMAVGMIFGGVLSDRLGHRFGHRTGRALVPMVGLLVSACLLGVGLKVTEPWAIVTCFAVALAAGGACEGPCWATAVELGGRRGGTAAGIFNTGGNVGGLLAPVVTPWISALFGWRWGILLGSAACLVAVVLWFGIDPHERVEETGESDSDGLALGACSEAPSAKR